jgi:hypothetical protein
MRIALLLAIAACMAGLARAGVVDLSSARVGGPPDRFESARTGSGPAGTWVVLQDRAVPSGRVIAQTSGDASPDRFPLAIYTGATARDFEASVRFRSVDGRVDQAAGIALRLRNAGNYYVVRADALVDNVRFYRVVNGRREQLAGADVKVESGVWHTLAVAAQGDRFTVSFDGVRLFDAQDSTFLSQGRVALWTKSDSVILFDRLDIRCTGC